MAGSNINEYKTNYFFDDPTKNPWLLYTWAHITPGLLEHMATWNSNTNSMIKLIKLVCFMSGRKKENMLSVVDNLPLVH